VTTSIIDPSLHVSSFPATYTGPGTLIGNPRQSGGLDCSVDGYFTSNGNTIQVNVGFRPLHVRVKNMTDGLQWEWAYGMPATDTLKTTNSTGVVSTDTGSAIVPSEDASNQSGNWIVTLSSTLAGTSKLILFEIDG
jgi:hypothetical protein